jgi:ankyrin repeat protein
MPIAQDPVEILQVKKLLHCVRLQDYQQIKKLCEKGVPYLVNYNEPIEGETALILASSMNNEKMIEFLIEHGAHPNIVDLKGRSALMRAAELGHVQALELLTKHKADPLFKDNQGKDVLFYCMSAPTNRHEKCLQIVLSIGANVNNKTVDGLPIFVEACKEANERKEMCMLLLENGSDPCGVDEVSIKVIFYDENPFLI